MESTPRDQAPRRDSAIEARLLAVVESCPLSSPAVNFGDLVRLRSGGPVLLVVAIDDPAGVTVAWQGGHGVLEDTLDRRCLRPLAG